MANNYVYLEGGQLVLRMRPDWRDDEGKPVSDAYLESVGIFAAVEPEDTSDPLTEARQVNPIDEWRYTEMNGALTSVIVTETVTPKNIEDVRAAKIAQINTDFEQAAAALTDGYPPAEQATWPTQQQEALAWAGDPEAATPYLDGLAAVREIDPEQMRELTLAQVQAFMAASQQLIGKRQRLRDRVYSASSVGEIVEVNW